MTAERWKKVSVSLLVLLYVILIPVFLFERSSQRELEQLRGKSRELSLLGREYRSLKEQVDVVEQRSGSIQAGGVAQAVDGLLSSVGLRGKMKSMKSAGTRDIGGMVEDDAEVQIEKLTLNEVVNVLYRIGDAPFIVSTKRVAIKKSFENPELFDVALTIALFTRKSTTPS